jgi:pyruvate formate-lyase activating enzyme-like uncharacterized protein
VTTAAPAVAVPANTEEEEVIAEDYDTQKKDTNSNNVNDLEYVDNFMGNLEKKIMVTTHESSCDLSYNYEVTGSYTFSCIS